MRALTLTISDISHLHAIENRLTINTTLSLSDQTILRKILSQFPTDSDLLANKIPIDEPLPVNAWDLSKLENNLNHWKTLFGNLPGWDYCPFSFLVDNDNLELLHQNVLIVAWFAPSYAYNVVRSSENRAYEVWLKDDGSAIFQLPTLKDAEKYPELYHFNGSWKEAYLLLIETLKKGWPMEEFPVELRPFLKK